MAARAVGRSGPIAMSFASSGSWSVPTSSPTPMSAIDAQVWRPGQRASRPVPWPAGSRSRILGVQPCLDGMARQRDFVLREPERLAGRDAELRSDQVDAVTDSVTGCSTESAFISRNAKVPSSATRNSAVPAPT